LKRVFGNATDKKPQDSINSAAFLSSADDTLSAEPWPFQRFTQRDNTNSWYASATDEARDFRSAVIRFHDLAGNVIETHEHKCDFKEP